MSFLTFLASDSPISEVENRHINFSSVNEAVEKKIDLPNFAPHMENIDKDKPGVVLWVANNETLGEISIRNADKEKYKNVVPTKFSYLSLLEWKFTETRANTFIDYIRKHLDKTSEIEVWHIWIGHRSWIGHDDVLKIRNRNLHIDELLPSDLERIFDSRHSGCITIKRA